MNINAIATMPEALKGFYPTPPPLADKLLAGIEWSYIQTVLENARMQKAIEEGLYWWAQEYGNKEFCVVYPQKHSDFTTEGQRLNHCVGGMGYYERHMKGKHMIFFIRKASEPEKSYFTAEIDVTAGRILQLYGFSDRSAPKEVRTFTEGFARAVVRWRAEGLERRAG